MREKLRSVLARSRMSQTAEAFGISATIAARGVIFLERAVRTHLILARRQVDR